MVWSPTHVERYLLCPQKWWFQLQEGEQPSTFQQAVGTAIHAGIQAHWLGGDPQVVAEQSLGDTWHVGIAEDPLMVRTWMGKALQRALSKVDDLLQDQGQVVATEKALGPGERPNYPGTLDLLTQHGEDPYLVVTDYKTHWNLDDRFVQGNLVETERSWQLHQYAWFAQEVYKLPVRYVRKLMVRCQPQPKAWVYAALVKPGRLEAWRKTAEYVWADMDRDASVYGGHPLANWSSCERYGRCQFYERCH